MRNRNEFQAFVVNYLPKPKQNKTHFDQTQNQECFDFVEACMLRSLLGYEKLNNKKQ